MLIESFRQVLADLLSGLIIRHGYTKEETRYSLVRRKSDIQLILSTRIYSNVKKVFSQKGKSHDIFADIDMRRYFGKKPRGKKCEISIKKKNEQDILGIIYLIGVALAELDRERERQILAEKEEHLRLFEEAKRRQAEQHREERRQKIEKEQEKVNGEEAKQGIKLIQEVLPECFTQKEIEKTCSQLNYNIGEEKFYFRFSSRKVRNEKKRKKFKASSDDPRNFAPMLKAFLSEAIRKKPIV